MAGIQKAGEEKEEEERCGVGTELGRAAPWSSGPQQRNWSGGERQREKGEKKERDGVR